jgi:hypothetical protein
VRQTPRVLGSTVRLRTNIRLDLALQPLGGNGENIHVTHIPQFENALLDIQYCSFYLFYRLFAVSRSTVKRTYDLFFGCLYLVYMEIPR